MAGCGGNPGIVVFHPLRRDFEIYFTSVCSDFGGFLFLDIINASLLLQAPKPFLVRIQVLF